MVNTKIRGTSKAKPFLSSVGISHGVGSLSLVLFIVYLEHGLKDDQTTIPQSPIANEQELPREVAHADDADFIRLSNANIKEM